MRIGLVWLCGIFSILSMQRASADFLPPDQAFAFQAVSTAQDQASFTWRITDGYYLYHDQIKVIENGKALSLQLPRPQQKDDPNFGMTDVHYGQVQATVAMQPKQSYKIEWQGCAESGLCYPVQRTTIHTDADGLLPESKLNQQSTTQKKLLDAVTSSSLPNTAIPVELQAKNTETVTVVTPANTAEVKEDENGLSPSFEVTALTEPSQASAPELDDALMMQASSESVTTTNAEQRTKQADWNNDQYFFYLLSTDNITLNLIIFLGLGILLAFLPCSLPLIPILSSILVQRHRGYRAGMIAGVFVVGMALIYALMGLAVAGLGYNFQRWLQSPIFIGLFAVMFVLFALNVFGIFQLSLPQGVLQRLDQWQQRQKGGTLWGSFIMGMISALIVGPCMSAPLAGALLFVAQLPEPWMGASYLFILGLGVGLPLLIACVFGAQYLPKPGVWMDRLKFTFGFVMLLLAVYFLRPLLPSVVYLMLMGLLCIGITVYILWRIRPHILQMPMQLLLIAMSLATAISGGWYVTQAWSQLNTTQATTLVAWQKVRTQAELEQALNKVKGQAVLIDVYADWCVACQPIEKEVLPRADVQTALDTVARIKLDLTEYEASQDIVLNDWQILGPPTMIFLDVQHQEQRNLRLTGTFSAAQLLSRLNRGTPP